MQKTFQVISDPGHAWCKVPLSTLADLRLVDGITAFSYMRKGYAYLEEDCDLAAFAATYCEETGLRPKLKEPCSSDRPSRIRNYDSYSPSRAAEWILKDILNTALHTKLRDKHKRTVRYLATLLSPDHISLTFLKEYLVAEDRLICTHVGD